MAAHRRRMHGNEPVINWSWIPFSHTVHQPQVYDVRFPRTAKQCPYPFPKCPGSSRMWNDLHSPFNRKHWLGRIRILEKHPNPLTRCKRCGRQVPEESLSNRHYTSEKCKQGEGKGASGARPYIAALRQVGSRFRSTPIPYPRRRCSHTWGGRSHSKTVIGRRYTKTCAKLRGGER